MTSQDLQLKSYQKRLKDDVRSLVDNLDQVLRVMKVENETRMQDVLLQMRVRAGNMTRASESIVRLIWDIKQFLIINDFPLINETITNEAKSALEKEKLIDMKLMALRDDISNELCDLEDEYYTSLVK